MAVTFPRTGGKVEIISSAMIDHLKWLPLLLLHSEWELFLLNIHFPQTPADITTRVLAVREH